MAEHDHLKVKWVDSVAETGVLWGTVLPNGTATGLVKYILDYKIDISSMQNYCAYTLHPKIQCSL